MVTTPFTTCDADGAAMARLRQAELFINPAVDPAQYHTAATEYWFKGLPTPHSIDNAVIAYDYGVCAFADIGDALATATSADHRIYLAGWWVVPDTPLKDGPGGLLKDYLSTTKAEIRGMFWNDPRRLDSDKAVRDKSIDNGPIASFLNGLPNGAAILDEKLPFFMFAGQQINRRGGVHHQKLVVVSGSSGLIAFTGGMDINQSRVMNSKGGYEPLHDVHVRVIGKESSNLLKVFEQRWLDHPASTPLDLNKFNKVRYEVQRDFQRVGQSPLKPDLASSTRGAGAPTYVDLAVTVGRTYANLPKFNNTINNEVYSFAPSGEETAWKIVQNAVQKARQFIYIEDQYFVSRRLKAELVKKLQDPTFEFLLVLMENSGAFEHSTALLDNEFPYLIGARNEIRTDFLAVDPQRKKWRMFTLKASADSARQQFCGSYVHSKTMLMDDDFAVIGTVNVDDRGYTYDTEIALGVTDDPIGRAARQKFARNLRLNLWRKHLGVSQDVLFDWRKGLAQWLKPPSTAMVVDGSALEDSPMLGPNAVLRNFPGEDRLWSEDVDPDAGKLPLPSSTP